MNPQPTEQQTKEILDRLEELHKKATPGTRRLYQEYANRWRVYEQRNDGMPERCLALYCTTLMEVGVVFGDAETQANGEFDVALHNAFPLLLSLSSRTLTAEAELQKARERIGELEALLVEEKHGRKAFTDKLSPRIDSLVATITSLRSTVARMEGIIKKLFASATPNPNDHPTMYVAWAEAGDFLNERKAALQPAQSAPALAQTSMDWDERLPYVPEKKTEGLPVQSAAKVEERYFAIYSPLIQEVIGSCCSEGIPGVQAEEPDCELRELSKDEFDSFGEDGGWEKWSELETLRASTSRPTPPQEQKTGGGEAELEVGRWAWSTNGEKFHSDTYDSPMEAAAAGFEYMADDMDEGQSVFVGRVAEPDLAGHIHAENVLEHISEQECFDNDWADDWPYATKPQVADLSERLQSAFKDWTKQHKQEPRWFTIVEDKEITLDEVKAWQAEQLSTQSPQPKEEQIHE